MPASSMFRKIVRALPQSFRQKLKASSTLLGWYRKQIQSADRVRFFCDMRFQQRVYQNWILTCEADLIPTVEHNIADNIGVFIHGFQNDAEKTLLSLPDGAKVYVAPECLPLFRHMLTNNQTLIEKNLRCGAATTLADVLNPGGNLNSDIADKWLCIIRSGDLFNSGVAECLTEAIEANPAAQVVYFDHDYLDEKGRRTRPVLKPCWDLDYNMATNYVGRAVFFNLTKLRQSNLEFDGFHPEKLLWHLKPETYDRRITHCPYVGFHLTQSSRESNDAKALQQFLMDAYGVSFKDDNGLRVMWPIPDNNPLVSIIIPTKDAGQMVKRCVDSIVSLTSYSHYEIILVNHDSKDPEALAYFAQLNSQDNVKVIDYKGTFNYAKINNHAVKAASGDYVLFLNNDTQVLNAEWLTNMLGLASRPASGCVGAKLYYPDGKIQHAGVILEREGVASHWHKLMPGEHQGYLRSLTSNRMFHAVTAACLMVRKSVFLQAGGFDQENLPVAFNDVDLCLRIEKSGFTNLFCAGAELVHYESYSRGEDNDELKKARFDSETAYIQQRWALSTRRDNALNRNLQALLALADTS